MCPGRRTRSRNHRGQDRHRSRRIRKRHAIARPPGPRHRDLHRVGTRKPCPLTNGTATTTFNPLPKGTHSVTANYNGDVGFASSTGTALQTVT
ncbi:Ig-like domain-containing protein [Streptomyces decoyicus]|uniref:Ig-like domain-containing protein n=1 Tax=Streptomyces decoyicus TaxID=249567 RepID=UPI000B09F49B